MSRGDTPATNRRLQRESHREYDRNGNQDWRSPRGSIQRIWRCAIDVAHWRFVATCCAKPIEMVLIVACKSLAWLIAAENGAPIHDPLRCTSRLERFREQVTLRIFAIKAAERFKLRSQFHALGDDRNAHVVR